MRSPIEFIEQLINKGEPLDVVERFATVFSPSLKEENACLSIKASNIDILMKWRGAQGKWFCMRQASNFAVGLLMPPAANLPAARCYYADVSEQELCKVLTTMPELEGMTEAAFAQAAKVESFRDRLQAYRDEHDTPLSRMVEKIASGRYANTTTRKTSYFDTDGKCLVCTNSARYIASTTIGVCPMADLIILTLCGEHARQVNKHYLIDFLSKWYGGSRQIKISSVTPENMLNWAKEAVKTLGCSVLKCNPEKCEVTGERPSRFRVVLRCEAASQKNSYAYMIIDPAGKNVGRIDDARDHPEQPIQWDHRHLNLPKDNKTVEPSFTVGMPLFDLPAIQRELESAEANWVG